MQEDQTVAEFCETLHRLRDLREVIEKEDSTLETILTRNDALIEFVEECLRLRGIENP